MSESDNFFQISNGAGKTNVAKKIYRLKCKLARLFGTRQVYYHHARDKQFMVIYYLLFNVTYVTEVVTNKGYPNENH